ncbi:AI-2E family transporter [Alistipes sp.]|uniref:AI-2E family transporter n=1 Tax=Alistipes sp. TaxID=1872444 RepID=UPI003AF0F115
MRTIREQYWRYSLFVLILGLGITIFVELIPFLGGLLGAVTIYVLLRSQMNYLTEERRWRRSLAASVLLVEAILCFLVPISLIVWLLVDKIQDLTLDPQSLLDAGKHVADLIRERTGYNLWKDVNVSSLLGYLPKLGQWVLKGIMSFIVNIIVLLFVLYFMLIGGRRMEAYGQDILPFNRSLSISVMREIHMIVRSNAIIIPLLAVAQGFVAYLGYLVFGVSVPLFWGVLTCFATVIPIVGTALIWVPIAGVMILEGRFGPGIGLLLFGSLVITQVDNVMRFVTQKKMADTHPLITIFGVVIGLSLFGFMGVIFGPLMLAMFAFCVDIFKRKYIDCPTDSPDGGAGCAAAGDANAAAPGVTMPQAASSSRVTTDAAGNAEAPAPDASFPKAPSKRKRVRRKRRPVE